MQHAVDALHTDDVTLVDTQKILFDFNNTSADYPSHLTITDLFEEQVKKTPDNAAVLKDDGVLTYDALNKISNRLAGYILHKAGIAEGDVVAVKLERSEYLIISIFGILKAGAIYLPVDNNMPEKRMEYIKEDSQYKLLIDKNFIDKFLEEQHSLSEENIARSNRSAEVCYIIYTSGTTGLPKGTMIEHHSLVNRLLWMQKNYSLSANDTILQKTSCSFDVSVWELLWWSIAGAKVVFLQDGHEKDPEKMTACIAKHSVTVMHFVPSMLQQFIDFVESDVAVLKNLQTLKRIYSSGEALTTNINNRFHQLPGNITMVNLYGPTEATIDVTYFECSKGLDSIPIGKPIDNTRVYILDDNQELVNIGVEGRIFLAGVGLARGYLNKPGLTAQRFVADPFYPGERMYDTGDLGRWLPDGNIEYAGRNDDQVKIRGFRIELDEISRNLEQFTEVSVAHTLKLDDKLVAFLLFKKSTAVSLDAALETHLRTELARSLPEYMIPHHFCQVREIPLTGSGKADKRQLAAIFKAIQDNARPAASATTLTGSTRDMAEIWAQVLSVSIDSINPARSFIEHGGDSLSMLKVVAMCKKKGYKIGVKEFLLSPYVSFFDGAHATENLVKKKAAVPVAADQAPFMLSPIQQFFFDNNKQGLKFIMHASYYINKEFNADAIRKSLAEVVNEHDSFRLRFKKQKGLWQQYYDFTSAAYMLEETPADEEMNVKQCIAKAMANIDVQQGPLLYANIFFEGDRPVLFLASHHLVMDAVSWKIFIGDLQLNYNA
jgi:amino acid adenylation domain-containing protein